MIVALNIAAMSEALTLATKAGVNPDLVYQAIRGGLGRQYRTGCESTDGNGP